MCSSPTTSKLRCAASLGPGLSLGGREGDGYARLATVIIATALCTRRLDAVYAIETVSTLNSALTRLPDLPSGGLITERVGCRGPLHPTDWIDTPT
jgi:hypothetical protein